MNRSTLIGPSRGPAASDASNPWQVQRDDYGVVWLTNQPQPRIEPSDWRQRMTDALQSWFGVVAVGAKRLSSEGRVFSMGEFVIHPKGFHHLGQGTPAAAFRFPEEADAIAGGVMAVDAHAYNQVNGDELMTGELAAVELCLRLRQAGGRCVTIPQVTILDTFSPRPGSRESQCFFDRWGFDWRAADLHAVQQRYGQTGLLWNVRFHSLAMPFNKYEDRPSVHWTNYQTVNVYRQRADHLVHLIGQLSPRGRMLDLGCGDGLFTHLAATQGAEVIGIDPELIAIDQARQQTQKHHYPGPRPAFVLAPGDRLPFEDASFNLVFMLDVIEHLPNPVAVLHEAVRVLVPDGTVLITTPAWQFGGWSDPIYHVTEYTADELKNQVTAIGSLTVTNVGQISGVYRDIIVVARRDSR